jgi:MYXO-CTERM domain-containing protein
MVGALVACLALGGAGAAEEANLSIEIGADGDATTDDVGGIVVAEDHDPPERYAWQLSLDTNYTLANVTVDEGFDVDRPRQLVPLLDGEHFVEVRDPARVDRPGTVFNLSTEAEGSGSYQLGLPGSGEANLTLATDRAAPEIAVVSVGNHTDVGFDVTTDTSEAAMAELFVETPQGERVQSYPTNRPGLWQTFPVQGLEANTTYEIVVDAWDWSGNEVTSERVEVTTEPEPDPPDPVLEPVRPEPNATVSSTGVVVEASYSEEGWSIDESSVLVFFDKERVDASEVEVGDGSIVYRADGPLEAREYHVSVEADNEVGGTGVARWSFQVDGDEAARSPGPLGLAGLALAAGLVARRRRS